MLSNSIKITIAAVALSILAIGNVYATQCSVIPPDNDTSINDLDRNNKKAVTAREYYETWTLLRDAQFPKVEAILEKRHQKNLASDGGDTLTLRNLSNMIGNSDTGTLVRMWTDQYPQSFFAQLTAGLFYQQQAGNARGSQTISKTSGNQLSEMSKRDEKAIAYLKKAMQLDPHSALPQSILLGIAAREGQAAGKTAEEWLQAANQADPKNLAARIQATNFLSPRWGGSFELLDQMVQQAKKSLSAQGIRYLEYAVMIAKANHEEVITKNKSEAQALYKRAKEICENSGVAQEAIIRTYQ
jgi:tetratricopeptide (TPR) repeat protein